MYIRKQVWGLIVAGVVVGLVVGSWIDGPHGQSQRRTLKNYVSAAEAKQLETVDLRGKPNGRQNGFAGFATYRCHVKVSLERGKIRSVELVGSEREEMQRAFDRLRPRLQGMSRFPGELVAEDLWEKTVLLAVEYAVIRF